jgi:hypothetical protein
MNVLDHVRHPGNAEAQIEDHEPRPPAADVDAAARLVEEFSALRRDDRVDADDHQDPRGGGNDAGPKAREESDRCDQQPDRQRGGQPVLRELAQQFVIEGRRSAGRGEPVAHPAHAFRRIAAPRGGGLLGRRRNAELLARHRGHAGALKFRKLWLVCAS